MRLHAKTITPPTAASSLWTVRTQSVPRAARSRDGMLPGSSVESTPGGLRADGNPVVLIENVHIWLQT